MASMTDIAPLLRQRWSPTSFDAQHVVGADDVRLLIEAARWAPSARNRQPWRFIVGRRGDATWSRLRAFVEGSSDWALDASLLVANIYGSWPAGLDVGLHDLGGAVAHMSVQGEALGLHARQFASFDRAGLSEEFAVAAPYAVVTMTAFGVARASAAAPERSREEPEALLWRGGRA